MTYSSDIYEAGAKILDRAVTFKLPQLPQAPAASSLPVMAALVPVVGALALWLILSSPYALIFAALGPLMLLASIFDGKRNRRRVMRDNQKTFQQQLSELSEKLSAAQARQREILIQNQPDLWGFVSRPEQIWRPGAQLQDFINVGTGTVRSCIELSGDHEHDDAAKIYECARRLEDSPVTIGAELGIAVVGGNAGLNVSILRALVLQMCARFAPERLRMSWSEQMPAAESKWLAKLPHARSQSEVLLWVASDAKESIPAEARYVVLVSGDTQYPTPRCTARILNYGADASLLETPRATVSLRVEGVTVEQAEAVAAYLAEQDLSRTASEPQLPSSLAFDQLRQDFEPTSQSLRCEIGMTAINPIALDLVNEGPHALVTGMTGSGKSELLVTWILAMCKNYSPEELQFLLVDFKGGSAFNSVSALPHLSSLVTDLDQNETQRVIKSLRAEILRREEALADLGARNIDEAANRLARLVVIVDEYAALINSDADFTKVFADLAARGRSLGIHLILGSQRASGVFNDAILANCPLRLSLRVNDEQDSKIMLGVPDAALLSGAKEQRGIALLLSPEQGKAELFRVALSNRTDIENTVDAFAHYPAALPICPPQLSRSIPFEDLATAAGTSLILGRFDDPDRQRQGTAQISSELATLAVVGDAASGKSNLLSLLASQGESRETVYLDASNTEAAWDELQLLSRRASSARTVIIDDLDQILLRMEGEHAQAVTQLLEQLLRQARQIPCKFFISARAAISPATRILDLCEQKILLHCNSKADFLNHGGSSDSYPRDSVPGRGLYRGLVTQIALAPRDYPQLMNQAHNITLRDYLGQGNNTCAIALVAYGEGNSEIVQLVGANSGLVAVHLEDLQSDTHSLKRDTIVYADPESWQRHWETLHRIKTKGTLLIDPNCASYFRLITGSRQLPPFVDQHTGRLWGVKPSGQASRIALEPLAKLR